MDQKKDKNHLLNRGAPLSKKRQKQSSPIFVFLKIVLAIILTLGSLSLFVNITINNNSTTIHNNNSTTNHNNPTTIHNDNSTTNHNNPTTIHNDNSTTNHNNSTTIHNDNSNTTNILNELEDERDKKDAPEPSLVLGLFVGLGVIWKIARKSNKK